jgi:hypothetical protein
MGMHAYEEAAAEYQGALHALKFAGPDEPLHCELLLRLGEAQARTSDYQQAEESCLRAAEIARGLGAPEQLARRCRWATTSTTSSATARSAGR